MKFFFVLFIFRQFFLGDPGKHRGDRFVILLRLAGQFCKRIVDPQKLSLHVHDHVRNLQILEQALLHLTILCGKCDHLIHNFGSAPEIHGQDNHHIDTDTDRKPDSCSHLNKIHHHIHRDQEQRQQDRPDHVALQPPGKLDFIVIVHLHKHLSKEIFVHITNCIIPLIARKQKLFLYGRDFE